jgi:hypothetical protein
MVDPQHLRDLAWVLSSFAEMLLLGYLVGRGLYRSHPAFCLYIAAAILQSAVLFVAYRTVGFRTPAGFWLGWGSQTLVTLARWFASYEIAWRLLSGYAGIWALARRVLLVVSVAALASSLVFIHRDWYTAVMGMERGMKLSIASFLVLLLIFARYYRVPVFPFERSLAIGFFLYSCFSVANYSLFENLFDKYSNLWNFLDILFFLATVFIWIYAVREYSVDRAARIPTLVSAESYELMSGQVNIRLRALNDHLAHFLRSEDPGQ